MSRPMPRVKVVEEAIRACITKLNNMVEEEKNATEKEIKAIGIVNELLEVAADDLDTLVKYGAN